ncbi:hypothetical protein BC832DRAFT_149454 [Gaertneriomyces semiglobifer]|nr:hypothetical protein BC832DRAFT_149454 [Gaertneriomyces semiglobifer]
MSSLQDNYDDALYTYLHSSPLRYAYSLPLSDGVKNDVLIRLKERLCLGVGVNLSEWVFPAGAPSGDGVEPEYQESQRGKACGHVFKRGEGVWRCRNCAFDETCVFCARCFHATNHDGHDVSFSIASGSGGCCDCGDPEAWKTEVKCLYHSNVDGNQTADVEEGRRLASLPEELKQSMKSTIATVLDFIIDTLAYSTLPVLPGDADDVSAAHPPEPGQERHPLDGPPHASLLYSLTLYNDESHSFSEVIETVMDATNCTEAHGKTVAEAVDANGRYVVKTSANVNELLACGRVLASIGLAVGVSSARQVFREEIVGICIDWLKSLPRSVLGVQTRNGREYEPVDAFIRQTLCEELSAPRRKIKAILLDVDMDRGMEDVPVQLWFTDNGDLNNIDQLVDGGGASPKLRIDYLLAYDHKMWKLARSSLKELYIQTMIVAGERFKKVMGVRFARLYPCLLSTYLFADREPDLSILSFSVQLFTVPTIIHYLLTHTNILALIFSILKAFYLSEPYPEEYKLIPLASFYDGVRRAIMESRPWYRYLKCEGEAAKNRRYWHLFVDLRYLLSSHPHKNLAFSHQTSHGRDVLLGFLDLLTLWQNLSPQRRYIRQHVEYESEHWVNAFNLGLQVSRCISNVVECLSYYPGSNYDEDRCNQDLQTLSCVTKALWEWSKAERHHSLRTLQQSTGLAVGLGVQRDIPDEEGLHVINVQNLTVGSIKVPYFRVDEMGVSWFHPLHWLLGGLIGALRSTQKGGTHVLHAVFRDSLRRMNPALTEFQIEEEILSIFDSALHSAVLLSQIRSGMWVRNGFSLRAQASHFRDTTLRESWDMDVFLTQILSCVVAPSRFLVSLMDRWSLVEFLNEPGNITNSPEKAQLLTMLEDFFVHLVTLICERSKILNSGPESELRREIIHYLASCRGLSYSELTKRCTESLADAVETDVFEEILFSVADYREPEHLTDTGMYCLKPELLSQVDPWYWHLGRREREGVEERLKTAGISLGPLLLPKVPDTNALRAVGSFVHEEAFVRLCFYGLWAGVSEGRQWLITEVTQATLCAVEVERHWREQALLPVGGMYFSDLASSIRMDVPKGREDIPGAFGNSQTLLAYVIAVLESVTEEDLSEVLSRLSQLLKSMYEVVASETARQTIVHHQNRQREALRADGTPSEQSELERKKAAAKEASKKRREEIMRQMKAQQDKFIEMQANLEVDPIVEDETHVIEGWESEAPESISADKRRSWDFPRGTCIVCQEECTLGVGKAMFGLLTLIQPSYSLRLISFDPVTTPPVLREIVTNVRSTVNVATDSLEHPGSLLTESGLHISSCGHLMHSQCFLEYYRSIESRHNSQPARNHPEEEERREYMCPLCKSLCNGFAPVLRDKRVEEVAGSIPERKLEVGKWFEDTVKPWIKVIEREVASEEHMDTDHPQKSEDLDDKFAALTSIDHPMFGDSSTRDFASLSDIFQDRLLDICQMITLEAAPDPDSILDEELDGLDQLWELFGYTIGITEAATRSTRLDFYSALGEKNGILLRVLSEDILVHSALTLEDKDVKGRFTARMYIMLRGLFCGMSTEPDNADPLLVTRLSDSVLPPFLMADGLRAFSEMCFTLIPASGVDRTEDIWQWVRICFVSEVVKCVVGMLEAVRGDSGEWFNGDDLQTAKAEWNGDADQVEFFIEWICQGMKIKEDSQRLLAAVEVAAWIALIKRLTLPLLRGIAMMLWARFGIVPDDSDAAFEKQEFDQLRAYLRCPSLDVLLSRETVEDDFWSKIIRGWLKQIDMKNDSDSDDSESEGDEAVDGANAKSSRRNSRRGSQSSGSSQLMDLDYDIFSAKYDNWEEEVRGSGSLRLIALPDPRPPRLIALPQSLSTLIETAASRTCHKCNTIPSEPALCLLCGTFVCSQSYCCQEDEKGECNVHARHCSGDIGLFFLVKKCVVLMLNRGDGMFLPPPYLDKYGEVDLGLRRGRPQFLNSKRYGEVQKLWLNHQIPSYIARKIESTFDTGGWQTL